MKRIISLILCLCMLLPLLSGCTDDGEKKSDGGDGKQSTEQNKNSGSDGNGAFSGGTLADAPSRDSILKLAEAYYKETEPHIESGFGGAFMRLVPKKPDFSGKTKDEDFVLETSFEAATSIFVYDAKNYNIAVSAAMVAKNPDSVSAVTNFAAAVAAYHDSNDFFDLAAFTETTDNQYYNDAVKIYSYAISISAENGKYTQMSLTPLTSLGNLLIDMGMSENALPFFNAALETDPDYTPARTGKRTALFVLKRFDEIDDMMLGVSKSKQPVQEEQLSEIEKWLEEIYEMPLETYTKIQGKSADEIAEIIKEEEKIEVMSKADALTLLSKEAEEQIRRHLNEIQPNMKLEAPDLSILFDYTDWQEFFTVYSYLPRAYALMGGEKFGDVWEELHVKYTDNYEKQRTLEEQLEKQYPKRGLEFVGPGIDEAEGISMFTAMFDKKMTPYALNPFDYSNPEDIFIQRGLLAGYMRKKQLMIVYIAAFEDELFNELHRSGEMFSAEDSRITEEYKQKRQAIWDKYEKLPKTDSNAQAQRLELHRLASGYYPRFKSLYENSWHEAVDTARDYYDRFSEMLPILYNDIMKYVMLISDPEVRDELETEANLRLLDFIDNSVRWITTFFDIGSVNYFDEYGYADVPPGVGDIIKGEELQKVDAIALEEAIAKYEAAMKGKAAFDAKILDENSSYYKNRIEKWEANYNLGFIQYKVNDYKQTTTMGFNTGIVAADISQTEYQYTGAVKMNGSLEIGVSKGFGDHLGVSAVGKFGWTAGMDANGNLIPKSVDLRLGAEGGINAFKVLDVKGGIEASVMRGLRTYGDVGLTANEIFNYYRTKAWEKRLGREFTEAEKGSGVFALHHNSFKLPEIPKVWSGEYVIMPPTMNSKIK